jgi:hypothetical protein
LACVSPVRYMLRIMVFTPFRANSASSCQSAKTYACDSQFGNSRLSRTGGRMPPLQMRHTRYRRGGILPPATVRKQQKSGLYNCAHPSIVILGLSQNPKMINKGIWIPGLTRNDGEHTSPAIFRVCFAKSCQTTN